MQPQTLQDVERVVALLKEHFGETLIAMALFGSAARGEATATSDLDVFAIIEGLPARHFKRCTLLNDLVLPHVPRRVTVVAKTTREFTETFPPLYLDLGLDAQMLYDSDGFLSERLARIRQIIRQAGLRRLRQDGDFAWRWQKQPRRGWEITWEGYRELE